MSAKYSVELTDVAEAAYNRIADEAEVRIARGDLTNSKVTLFNMVEEMLDKIIPHDPFKRERGLSGPLSNIFRVKKGRIRICYIASSRAKHIVVLYISETLRKEGDVNDPYAVFTQLVKSGRYDRVFDQLGVKRPTRRTAVQPPLIQSPAPISRRNPLILTTE